ncbi:MAG TPA: hypothetical protein VGN61_09115 [Verrucomicrobiae bacterium]
MNRNGKIANLPATLIEQLNIRLDEGFSGPQILNWLNNHKETRKVLKEEFDGVPISKQNLSQWRNGGYQEWRVRNDFDHYIYSSCAKSLDLRRDQDINLVADYLAAEVAALYAKFLATWDGQPTKKAEAQLRVLRGLNRDIALLQKTMERADQHMIAHEKAEEKRIEKMVDEAFIDGLRKGMREAQSNQVKVETPVKPQEEENSQDTDPEEDTEETEPETPADAVNGEEPENSPEPLTQHPSEPKNVTQLSSVTPVAPGYSLPTTRA